MATQVAVASLEQTSASALIIPPLAFWCLLIGAILFTATGYLLKKLSRLFYVYEFEHARND